MLSRNSILHGFMLMLVLMLGVAAAPSVRASSAVTLTHVHGLAFSADGERLLIPSHDGLAIYADGKWSKAAGPTHDYMGFSATRDALYSSGHPAQGSRLVNPFGLIKSADGGKTWQKRGLEGESDFHTLATSYGTNAIYVVNHRPNSRMKASGIYYSLNDGFEWKRADAKGLGQKINTLAVHPADPRLVAAGTDDGLYLSRNSGNDFERLVGGSQVLSAMFDLDEDHLWFGGYAGKPLLARIALKAGAKGEDVALPALDQDAVAYIAQNPLRHDEIAIATFKRSVYLSTDQGKTWKRLAVEGTTL